MRGYVQGSGLHARLVVAARTAELYYVRLVSGLFPAGRARVFRTHVSVQVCRTPR
jgi:hypothetical protein